MCGIVGYIGRQDAVPILMEGLHRLEYRGYDSAGIAVVRGNELRICKSKGKVRELARGLPASFRGHAWNCAHALGDTRRAERSQRAPAHRRAQALRDRAQRHHRECRGVARPACGTGCQFCFGDRLGSARAPHRRNARRYAGGWCAGCITPHHRSVRGRGDRCGAPGLDRGRTQWQPGHSRHRCAGNVRGLGCRRARAPHSEHRASG